MHAEGYEQHQGQGTRPKAASSGFNSARDLFLQQQSNKNEDIAERGKVANPFARSKAKVADPAAHAYTVPRLHDIGVLEELLMHCSYTACKPVIYLKIHLFMTRAAPTTFVIWKRVTILNRIC